MGLFEGASSEFVNMKDDLNGRLLLITPVGIEFDKPSTIPGAKEGDTYDACVAEIVVLDGEASEKVPSTPFVIDGFQISGAMFNQITRKEQDPGKPKGTLRRVPRNKMLGRVVLRKSKFNSWYPLLDSPTPADEKMATEYLDSLKSFEGADGENPFADVPQ